MEKRIRIVWILSLASALLLIGVQGYWLYNQYRLVVDTYSEEVAREILDAGEEEYQLRNKNQPRGNTFIMNTNAEYKKQGDQESRKQQVLIGLGKDSVSGEEAFDKARMRIQHLQNGDSTKLDTSHNPDDSINFRLSFHSGLSGEKLLQGVNRAMANYNNPFKTALLDSILTSRLSHNYTITAWELPDTVDMYSSWQQAGHLFAPVLEVYYAYSPLELKGVLIRTTLPSEPVFGRMAGQLLISFGLILLLIGCLVFQIKTILKQKKLNELRQSFVNTMIHELKRPVQTLKAFVSFLGDKEMRSDETATEQVVQDSMFELDNLSAYLNKLKDMVRADDTETPLHISRFDLKELTEKVIRLIHIPAGKEVEFSKYFDMESPWVEADPVHVANILSNLIENAVKYSGEQVHIEIKARQKGHELWLSVADNGIGIPLVEQDKVFAKFYRGSNLPDRNLPGLGLGLSYVKLISEAHQGTVSLQSNIGSGTVVTLFLPQ